MRSIAVLFALLMCVVVSPSQVKKPLPPAVKVPFNQSLQAIVVKTDDWSSVKGTAQMIERKDLKSDWKRVGESFPVVVGMSGLAWGDYDLKPRAAAMYKKEGDGRAPAGLFPLISSFGTAVKPEALESPYTRLDKYTECVDDVRSNHYNKIVNRMQVGSFDWKSSEKMLAFGEQYDLGIFVGFNTFPVEPGRGSCIFLRPWKGPDVGTSGSTAMERRSLELLFGRLTPTKNPYLVQLPASEYDHLRKTWKLPKIK